MNKIRSARSTTFIQDFTENKGLVTESFSKKSNAVTTYERDMDNLLTVWSRGQRLDTTKQTRVKLYSVLKNDTTEAVSTGHSARFLRICDGMDSVPAILDECGPNVRHYVSWIAGNTDFVEDKVAQDKLNTHLKAESAHLRSTKPQSTKSHAKHSPPPTVNDDTLSTVQAVH